MKIYSISVDICRSWGLSWQNDSYCRCPGFKSW